MQQQIFARLTRAKQVGAALATAALLVGMLSLGAGAQVAPDSTDLTLEPGESADPITKTVTIPPVPTRAEICFVVDVSASFGDDIRNLNAQAATIAALAPPGSGVLLGLAWFNDYEPQAPAPYGLVQALTDGPTWEAAVPMLIATRGGDFAESQLDGFVGAAVGLTVDTLPLPSCGWSNDPGVDKFILATTDAPCHEPRASRPQYQNSTADTIAILNAENITFLGLETRLGASCFSDLAAGTGGVVEQLASDGSNIATAVSAALSNVDFDVTPTPVDCDGLTITFDPPTIPNLEAGDVVTFTEKVTFDGPDSVSCVVRFGPAGDQVLNVTAADMPPAPTPTPAATAEAVPVFVAPVPTPAPEALTIDNQVMGFPSSQPFSYTVSSEVEGCSMAQVVEISGSGGQIGPSVLAVSETTGEDCAYSVVQNAMAHYEPDVGAFLNVAPDAFVRFINQWNGATPAAPAPTDPAPTDPAPTDPAPTDEVLGKVITSEPLAHTGGDTDIATIGFYLLALGTAVAGASRVKRRRI